MVWLTAVMKAEAEAMMSQDPKKPTPDPSQREGRWVTSGWRTKNNPKRN